MKLGFTATSSSGKWAIRVALALVILTIISLFFAAAIKGDSTVIERNLFLKILAEALSILFTLAGPISFIIGIYTIIRYKEWSILKPLVISYLMTILLFVFAEFLFQH